ncbi:MmcQ/YjbR family DNA-binding protein [Flavobacteriaceae bacterium]|nr:MmcQ/YjbR family DNA-binding protein [Flavobacteriaceae bacterium]MDB2631743.1 MmcQ/YjbR family DNA-binding protein [Flavobacteriaceae bacterium]
MTVEHIRMFCLDKPKATEEFPFDEDTLVFKVLGKIFALCPLEKWEQGRPSITLKCDPDYALELREKYDSIKPGFHANKRHWNTIHLKTNALSPKLVFELIAHSYDMVVKNMTKKQREMLNF